MTKLKECDYIGKIYGRLKILRFSGRKNSKILVECECQCEDKSITVKPLCCLKNGNTKSCGCMRWKSKVKYVEYNDFYEGIMTNGSSFFIDKSDYYKIKKYGWHLSGNYVKAKINNKIISLHRFILNENNPSVVIDHKNCNSLDNRRENIRRCTVRENSLNKKTKNKFGVSGISKKGNGYEATIRKNGKKTYLGYRNNLNDIIALRLNHEIMEYGEDFSPNRRLFKEYDIFRNDVSDIFKIIIYSLRHISSLTTTKGCETEDMLHLIRNNPLSDYEFDYIKEELCALSNQNNTIESIREELVLI